MIARHSKIARLPHDTREELNRRLFNGALSPELLPWLNQLPAVQEVLRQFFDGAPINRQNLSDWRRGGYEDWLRHQERELRIQRITEEGAALKNVEGEDLFEDAARIAAAELMAEMDSLDKLKGEERWNRLRSLTRELVRLQNGYNRSRWAELAWTRWNKSRSRSRHYEESPATDEIDNPDPISDITLLPSTVKVDQASSNTGEPDNRVWIQRIVHHPRGCDCICPNCHPDDGEYPHAEAVKDTSEAKERGVRCFWREKVCTNLQFAECDCTCNQCQNSNEDKASAALAPKTPEPQPNLQIPKIPVPASSLAPFNPTADFLRQVAHRKAAAIA